MSSTRTRPWRPAISSALRLAASTPGALRWVPVMARQRQRARNASLMALGVQGHVGAVLAGEEQGEGLLVLDAQQHHAGQALGIDLHLAGVAALAAQRLDQEAAILFIAHARNHGRAQPQARRAESHVAGGAAQVLGKAAGLLQAAADLLRVKVHGQSAQAGHVQRPVGGKVQHAHRHRPVRCGHPRAGLSIIRCVHAIIDRNRKSFPYI